MFVYSVRASTVRFFGVIALTLALLIGTLALGGGATVAASAGTEASYRFTGVRDEAGRVAFFRQFGIEVGEGAADERTFVLPGNFDRVLVGYNEVQRQMGLDLGRYKNKKVTRFTYEVKNAPEGMTVYAGILVYRGRVIAADLASADPSGFVLPLTAFSTLGDGT